MAGHAYRAFAPIVRCWIIPDPVSHVLKAVGNALRAKLADAHKSYVDMYASQNSRIGSQLWRGISSVKKSARVFSRMRERVGADGPNNGF